MVNASELWFPTNSGSQELHHVSRQSFQNSVAVDRWRGCNVIIGRQIVEIDISLATALPHELDIDPRAEIMTAAHPSHCVMLCNLDPSPHCHYYDAYTSYWSIRMSQFSTPTG
jgi:hypothetical protein